MGERLKNKVAVITGACSGIGLGTLELFVEEGASVIAADIQDEVGQQLEMRFGQKVRYAHCDVTKTDQIKGAIDRAVAQFGGLDVLFNNAGAGGVRAGVEDMDLDGWDETHALLLRSVVAGCKFATPHMKARGGGAIVNTSSITALQAGYGPISYSVAKAGVLHFTRLAAAELSAHKIRINAICPGLIATSIFGASLGMTREAAAQMAAMVAERGGPAQPIGRAGAPRDIAEAALYLASDAAGFVTGTHLVVDGGITIGPRHSWDLDGPNPVFDMLGITPEQAQAMRLAQKRG